MVKLLQVSDTAMILRLHFKQNKKKYTIKYLIQPQNTMLNMLWVSHKTFSLLLSFQFLSTEKMIDTLSWKRTKTLYKVIYNITRLFTEMQNQRTEFSIFKVLLFKLFLKENRDRKNITHDF